MGSKVHGYGAHGSWTRHSKITAKTCLYLLLAYQLVRLFYKLVAAGQLSRHLGFRLSLSVSHRRSQFPLRTLPSHGSRCPTHDSRSVTHSSQLAVAPARSRRPRRYRYPVRVPPGQPGHTRYCTGILCVPAPPGVLRREKDSGILVPGTVPYHGTVQYCVQAPAFRGCIFFRVILPTDSPSFSDFCHFSSNGSQRSASVDAYG